MQDNKRDFRNIDANQPPLNHVKSIVPES